MNRFETHEDIFGRNESARLNQILTEFLENASKIRHRLGKQAYLLDQYIVTVMKAADNSPISTAAGQGGNAANQLSHLCHSVLSGKGNPEGPPMYEMVKAYIDTHPLANQDYATKLNLYCIALSADFLICAAEEYYQQQETEQEKLFDIVHLRQLFRDICDAVGGEDEMDRLNLLLRQRFLIVTPMAVFLQCFSENLIYCLTQSDNETGKPLVRLWLEGQALGCAAGPEQR